MTALLQIKYYYNQYRIDIAQLKLCNIKFESNIFIRKFLLFFCKKFIQKNKILKLVNIFKQTLK